MNYVVDASVLAAMFLPQAASDASIAFVENVLADASDALLAPDCVYYEVAATLRKFERLKVYHDLDEDLFRLYSLPIATTTCKELMLSAALISRAHTLSIYDAFYLALSQHAEAPLVTIDNRLVNGVKGKGFDVRFVSTL